MEQIKFTDNAVAKVAELLVEENKPNLKFRAFVQGGGCSGFSYGFSFDDVQNEDDFVLEYTGVKVLVDAMSMQYLTGSVIDYTEDLMGASFSVNNPNAETTCGCGSSFSYNYDDDFEYDTSYRDGI
jgi:iron-sulfur cluster insertion protein